MTFKDQLELACIETLSAWLPSIQEIPITSVKQKVFSDCIVFIFNSQSSIIIYWELVVIGVERLPSLAVAVRTIY